MDAKSLAGGGGRPIRVALANPVDCFVGHIDKFLIGSIGGLDTEKFGIAVLAAGTSGGTDPVVLANNSSMVGDRIAVGGSAQIRGCARGLVILADLVAVQK